MGDWESKCAETWEGEQSGGEGCNMTNKPHQLPTQTFHPCQLAKCATATKNQTPTSTALLSK